MNVEMNELLVVTDDDGQVVAVADSFEAVAAALAEEEDNDA